MADERTDTSPQAKAVTASPADVLVRIQHIATNATGEAAMRDLVGLAADMLPARGHMALVVRDGVPKIVERTDFEFLGSLPVRDLAQGGGPLSQPLRGEVVRGAFVPSEMASLTGRAATSDEEHPLPLLGVPLELDGEVFGALFAVRAAGGDEFSEAEERIASALALQGAIALGYFASKADDLARLSRAESLRDTAQRLQREQAEFLAMISHDIKTPISSIYGFAETLLDRRGQLPEEEQEAILRLIGSQAQRIDRLVNGLLEVARAESGALRVQRQRVHLCEVVRDAVDGAGVEVFVDDRLDGDEDVVLGDHQRLEQVVVNLLTNADRYGRAPIELHLFRRRNDAVIEVVDHGGGVPTALRDHLFQRFSPGAGHIGLGLAIVRVFTEAHGGTVSYADNEPYGARFVVVLPLRRS